jgi:hypothetical protein
VRKDRTAGGGGLMAYIRSDLPSRHRPDLDLGMVESIVLEVTLSNRKWAILGAYKPPSMCDKVFEDDITNGVDRILIHYDNIMIIGDLNFDLLHPNKGSTLKNICDIFDVTNLVKSATCFVKNSTPSLVDVILTNKANLCYNTTNFDCGLSDWHHMINTVVKGYRPRTQNSNVSFRSFKHFDEASFSNDIGYIPFHAAYVFEDVDDIYWAHEKLMYDVIDEHAPIQEKTPKHKKSQFFNGELRKAIYKKRTLHNKFLKCKSHRNWDLYRKQRNWVTKLRKQSVRVYFLERCAGGPKSKDF